MILALETSCDDTCAAVIDGPRVLSDVVSSQAAFHESFGGVVPEVASRHHLQLVNAVVAASLQRAGTRLEEVEAVAVTRAPGLIGALLVGVSTAKALAAVHRKPLIPVDHLHGHVAANYLEPDPIEPPFLCLVASGGHTFLAGVRELPHPRGGPGREAEEPPYDVLGATLDDAAGEAFDKGARLLGLGYPGGPAIERAAREGDPEAFEFPVAMAERGLDFSFSGVKTALVYRTRELGPERTKQAIADLAASYQRAIIGQLVAKLERAARGGEWETVALGGGVAANSVLRGRAEQLCAELGLRLKLVPIELCTDNAAMIGSAARFGEPIPYPDYLDLDAFATGDTALHPA
ncbi:MAG: tRNA (adenosine(37)-N6)-threonylcarbamoyltransferase complex transferase subunit TsaD [Solirubrobacterales bacterium]